jgi:hypothetical protein
LKYKPNIKKLKAGSDEDEDLDDEEGDEDLED